MSNPDARLAWRWLVPCVALATLVTAAACHKTESGVPVPKVFAPRTFPQCGRRIELINERIAPPHRVLSEVFVTCKAYWTDECDDALRARACELGGDAVVVGKLDENSSPRSDTPPSAGRAGGVRRGRHGLVVVWISSVPSGHGSAADAGTE